MEQSDLGPRRRRRSSAYHAEHPQITTRLTPEEAARVRAVVADYGMDLRTWILTMANRCLAERKPESQGGVKIRVDGREIQVDFEALLALSESADREADYWHRFANAIQDPGVRAHYRRVAGRYHDAAMWLTQVIEAGRRRYQVLRDGLRTERHRFRASGDVSGALPGRR